MGNKNEFENSSLNSAEIWYEELLTDNHRDINPIFAGLANKQNLEILSFANNGFTSLKGFPELPKLRWLDFKDNNISGGLNYLNGCRQLTILNLSGNKISTIDALEPLKKNKCLKQLYLSNCEVSNIENYKEKVFALLPGLQYLDGFERNFKTASYDSEEAACPAADEGPETEINLEEEADRNQGLDRNSTSETASNAVHNYSRKIRKEKIEEGMLKTLNEEYDSIDYLMLFMGKELKELPKNKKMESLRKLTIAFYDIMKEAES